MTDKKQPDDAESGMSESVGRFIPRPREYLNDKEAALQEYGLRVGMEMDYVAPREYLNDKEAALQEYGLRK